MRSISFYNRSLQRAIDDQIRLKIRSYLKNIIQNIVKFYKFPHYIRKLSYSSLIIPYKLTFLCLYLPPAYRGVVVITSDSWNFETRRRKLSTESVCFSYYLRKMQLSEVNGFDGSPLAHVNTAVLNICLLTKSIAGYWMWHFMTSVRSVTTPVCVGPSQKILWKCQFNFRNCVKSKCFYYILRKKSRSGTVHYINFPCACGQWELAFTI